jgi:DNA replication protein DnaC
VEQWIYENVPAGYRDTKIDKLPCQAATKALMGFDFFPDNLANQKNGLYLYGPTGSGKTRSAFLKVQSALVTMFEPTETVWVRGSQFAREVVNRTRPGGDGGFEAWFTSLLNAQLLCIDEVDKIKFSERVMSEFFDLIEHRTSHQRCVILISNSDVATLCDKMSGESGPAVARRIVETLLPIRFAA